MTTLRSPEQRDLLRAKAAETERQDGNDCAARYAPFSSRCMPSRSGDRLGRWVRVVSTSLDGSLVCLCLPGEGRQEGSSFSPNISEMQSRRIRISLAAAVVVAGFAFGPLAVGQETQGTGSFVALSYNVAGLPEPLSGSEPATNSPLISPLLNEYDLVLLQENWQDHLDQQRKAGLVPDEVPPMMYHHLVVQDAEHEFRSIPLPHPYGIDPDRAPTGPPTISDGLNRLSRFPFTDIDPETRLDDVDHVKWRTCNGELHFAVLEEVFKRSGLDDVFDDAGLGVLNDETDGGAADCGAQKGFSVARTELAPGVTVDVYNLHADAGGHDEDQNARADNFAQLAGYIEAFSAGQAVILGGDTNLHIDRNDRLDPEIWSEFQKATGLIDVCAVVNCGEDTVEIDKFAFRSVPGLKIIPQTHSFERDRFSVDGAPLSDHDPLAVRFHWVATGRR